MVLSLVPAQFVLCRIWEQYKLGYFNLFNTTGIFIIRCEDWFERDSVLGGGESEDAVCTSVLSGTTSGRTFPISYTTAKSDTQGKLHKVVADNPSATSANQCVTTAPGGDYMRTNVTFEITDSNSEQCTSISLNTTKIDECFNYTISAISTDFNFTIDPTTATICIISDPGEGITIRIM